MEKEVSVVLTCYNAEETISEAIESILSQTFEEFDFIILDDSSTDRTVDIIKNFSDSRITLIENEKRKGLAPCRNLAIEKANTRYIAIMDADDISCEERLEVERDFLDSNPDYGIVGSNAIIIDGEGNRLGTTDYPTSYEEIKKRFLFGGAFINSSTMFRKSLFKLTGGYYDIPGYDDDPFFLEMCSISKGKNLSKPLLKDRVHPDQSFAGVTSLQTRLKLSIRALALFDYSIRDISDALIERFDMGKVESLVKDSQK